MVGNPVDIFQKQEIEKSVKYKSFFFWQNDELLNVAATFES